VLQKSASRLLSRSLAGSISGENIEMTTAKGLDRETEGLQSRALLAARLLLAPLFIYSGIGKIMAFGLTASRLPGGEGGLGSFLAAGAIVVELGCSRRLSLESGHAGRH
jgi:hypothetical protein